MEEKIQAAIDAWQNAAEHNPHFPEDGEQTLAQSIAQALSGICVEVRDLEWQEPARDGDAWVAEIPGGMGFFACREYRGGWLCWFSRDEEFAHTPIIGEGGSNEFSTLEAAQQACQADFASRWASCARTRTVEEVRREYLEEQVQKLFRNAATVEMNGLLLALDEARAAEAAKADAIRAAARFLQQEGKTNA